MQREHGEELYRIFVYDCKPIGKKAHNPVTGKAIDFSKTSVFKFRNDLHRELVSRRKVALRLGELSDNSHWIIRPDPLHEHIDGLKSVWVSSGPDGNYEIAARPPRSANRPRRIWQRK